MTQGYRCMEKNYATKITLLILPYIFVKYHTSAFIDKFVAYPFNINCVPRVENRWRDEHACNIILFDNTACVNHIRGYVRFVLT